MSTYETLKIGDRIYRPVTMADIPKILTNPGSMKVYFIAGFPSPARLVSTQYGMNGRSPEKRLLWLYENVFQNEYTYEGIENVCLDITPEKRYAIWNKKYGRFVSQDVFLDRRTAEHSIAGSTCCVVLEFDYPGDFNDGN